VTNSFENIRNRKYAFMQIVGLGCYRECLHEWNIRFRSEIRGEGRR
jgi:hypothetical protein